MTDVNPMNSQTCATKCKTPIFWSEKAIQTLLKLLEECNGIQLIDGRRVRNSTINEKIAEEMMTHGFKYSG